MPNKNKISVTLEDSPGAETTCEDSMLGDMDVYAATDGFSEEAPTQDVCAYGDDGVESPKATRSVHPGHIWQHGAKPPQPAKPTVSEEVDESPSFADLHLVDLSDLLMQQHAEVLSRLEQQDAWLNQILVRFMSTPHPVVPAVAGSMPVSKLHSNRSRQSTSDRGDDGAGSVQPRRSSVRSNGSHTPRPPRLFSTFTQYNLELKDHAEGAHAERSRKIFASQRQDTSLRSSPQESCLAVCKRIVESNIFDLFFALVVLTNSVFIGVEVQIGITSPGPRPLAMAVLQYMYTTLFAIELLLRGIVGGRRYFCGEEWVWSWLDVFIVLSSLWEVVVDVMYLFLGSEGALEGMLGMSGLKAFRIIRITRLFKAVRLMRIFRFVRALRTLITSILATLKSLFWALVLLCLIVYVFSVVFTQVVNDELSDSSAWLPHEKQQAERYFGDLYTTGISLFMSIAGGVSWEAVLKPLENVSHFWAVAFLLYISFTYFAVLNVVTGVFCHSAIESAQHDHAAAVQSILEDKEAHVEKVRELFSKFGAEAQEGGITFVMLQDRLNDSAVREYLETLGLDISDAWSFFKLLDLDGGGSVEIEEFLMGCLRLRGNARAIDVSKIIHDQTWLIRNQGKFQTYVESQMAMVHEELHSLRRAFVRSLSCMESPGLTPLTPGLPVSP